MALFSDLGLGILGGALTSQLGSGGAAGGGGGGQNLTLSQTARRTKKTPCHNIPY